MGMKGNDLMQHLLESLQERIQELNEVIEEKDQQISLLHRRTEELLGMLEAREAEIEARKAEIEALRRETSSRAHEASQRLNEAHRRLSEIYQSKTWKIGEFYGRCVRASGIYFLVTRGKRFLDATGLYVRTHYRVMKTSGMKQYVTFAYHYRKKWLGEKVKRFFPDSKAGAFQPDDRNAVNYRGYQEGLRKQLSRGRDAADVQKILRERKHRGIVLYPSPIGWNIPLYQRPHHILKELSVRGYAVFFLTPSPASDSVEGVRQISENLYLVSSLGYLRCLTDLSFYLWITWTPTFICKELFPKSIVVYDWIDELDVFYLYGQLMKDDHRKLLGEANVVIASSNALAEKVKLVRPDVTLAQNGVNMGDFQTDESAIPEDLASIMSEKTPIIGFYGSLEAWRMDYELVNYLSLACGDLNFVFIGPSYDGSSKRLVKRTNLFLLGPKNYENLKQYLKFFDVAIIPYVVNRITNSVFPVKLCEYLAGGVPVVTSDLRECRGFKTVFVSKNYEHFAQNIRRALTKKNEGSFQDMLKDEALDNTWHKRVDSIIEAFEKAETVSEARKIVDAKRDAVKGIVIYCPTIDWNLPLFQRPHHLAVQLSRLGYLTFYCTGNAAYDSVSGFRQIEENLYLTDSFWKLTEELSDAWVIVSSISSVNGKEMKKLREMGFRLIYDYLDEIHGDISGSLTDYHAERHRLINSDLVDLVSVISVRLREEMTKRFPEERVLFIPNGVDYSHFHRERNKEECPEDLRSIVEQRKPIIGYHGAFAQWIDYGLINAISAKKPEWNIVLIGWDYDGSMKFLQKRDNIRYLGLKQYQELPRYSIWFDVAIIPFKEGDIAKSTSPIKLFEYMAMNKPTVVTKDLIECHGEGVLRGIDSDDFIRKVEEALALGRKPSFLAATDREARANTWEARACVLDEEMQKIGTGKGNIVRENQQIPARGTMPGTSRFEALIKKKWGVSDLREIKDPVHVMWIEWALSTFERGESIKNFVSGHTEIRGKRYLDVGCGYGGFLAAFSRSGAKEAVGLEINPVYFDYYEAISKDCGMELRVYKTDILNKESLKDLGEFDIITCNDVIEHVEDPDGALSNMAQILAPGGVLFMQIPNRFSASFIEADGHFKLFGITLLPKWMADRYHSLRFPASKHDVCYGSLKYYLNTLRRNGLRSEVTNKIHGCKDERLQEIQKTLKRCTAKADSCGDLVPADLQMKVQSRLKRINALFTLGHERYEKTKQSDEAAANALAERLIILFGEDFWQILARKENQSSISGKALD